MTLNPPGINTGDLWVIQWVISALCAEKIMLKLVKKGDKDGCTRPILLAKSCALLAKNPLNSWYFMCLNPYFYWWNLCKFRFCWWNPFQSPIFLRKNMIFTLGQFMVDFPMKNGDVQSYVNVYASPGPTCPDETRPSDASRRRPRLSSHPPSSYPRCSRPPWPWQHRKLRCRQSPR